MLTRRRFMPRARWAAALLCLRATGLDIEVDVYGPLGVELLHQRADARDRLLLRLPVRLHLLGLRAQRLEVGIEVGEFVVADEQLSDCIRPWRIASSLECGIQHRT